MLAVLQFWVAGLLPLVLASAHQVTHPPCLAAKPRCVLSRLKPGKVIWLSCPACPANPLSTAPAQVRAYKTWRAEGRRLDREHRRQQAEVSAASARVLGVWVCVVLW